GDSLRLIESHPELRTLGIVRQGIAENPASINRKVNSRFGDRWTIGEGVFTLTKDELARLRLGANERSLLRPYHDLRDLGRYYLATDPSLTLIYSTKRTCADISRYPKLCAHLERFRPIMEGRRETLKGSNDWW